LFCLSLTLSFTLSFGPGSAGIRDASPPAAVEETARAHHEQGRLSASAGRYETAIAEYRRAYELKADPSFLYDIAEAYRGLGVPERAVFFYRRYLSTHTNPPNRPEVESQIAALEPPTAPPLTEASVVGAPPPLVLTAPVHPVSDRERSVVGRWWFWTAIGALAAAGATVAILAATQSHGGNDVPQTPLGNARIDF
jgi:tetratricopeptide (TPR) repeat protein